MILSFCGCKYTLKLYLRANFFLKILDLSLWTHFHFPTELANCLELKSYKMITLKEITASATFPVRHSVLRKGKPIETCSFDNDDNPTTKHFGLFDNEELKGVVSVFEKKNPLFNKAKQFQIRGMAVLENVQGYGFGKMLMLEAEKYCKAANGAVIWFNARENAVGFYENMGYKINGTSFDIAGIGIHYVMYKQL